MSSEEAGAGQDEAFEALLHFLKQTRGFDFTGYKRSSLIRRVRRRMDAVGVFEFAAYTDFLQVHPEEFMHLFNTILINVTSFFRDAQAWDYVREHIAPALTESDRPIRVWSAACASGEEAYTVAMVLAERLGESGFLERVKIYATDADEEALNQARLGSYSPRDVEGVPEELREKYFQRTDHAFVFRKDLRRAIIFGRHDLVQDAPISRIDLLICRHTLMYFNADAQAKILTNLHYALNPEGYLFLGRPEMLLTHTELFQPLELKKRIFRPVPRGHARERMDIPRREFVPPLLPVGEDLRQAAFEASRSAEIVVDNDGHLRLVNAHARAWFGIPPSDVGRPLRDLEFSYRPVELRSLIDRAVSEDRPVTARDVLWVGPAGDQRHLDVDVIPLLDAHGESAGVMVSFTDMTRYRRLQDELQTSKRDLETAYEELQSTVEELETTNEELHSTNEELETTNEELQSTNEELETMNEELQSTIEEMETINQELEDRTTELNQSNASLESILAGIRLGVIVADRDLRILAWNRRAEDLWGLREAEVRGEHLLNLDIGLPLEQLRKPIRTVLSHAEQQDLVLDAVTRRGKSIQCVVKCAPRSGAHLT
ncbi:MAG TPA: CheR family methyltransferase, partial [Actinomycetota bacterium]|nr:CheR family methyltransferase [Actinomycetota bacterium]